MRRRPPAHLAHPAIFALAALAVACPAPRAPRAVATTCPEAARLLDEAAAARAGGYLFRALDRAEAADRACSGEPTRRAVAELREALWGPAPAPESAPAAGDAEAVRAAAIARLAGEPVPALARLRPMAARLEPAGLVELARLEEVTGHAAEARAALERAVSRAERRHGSRGRWHWRKGGVDRHVKLAFAPDGERLVAADERGAIRIWELAGGAELVSLQAGDWLDGFAISPDGAWLATSSADRVVAVRELATGKLRLELRREGPVAFTPEGRLVAGAGNQEGLLELEVPSGKTAAAFGTGEPRHVAVTRDRIYGAYDGPQAGARLVAWERGGARRKLEERPLPASVRGLLASPRGELVAHLLDRILIHDAAGRVRHTIEGPHGSIAITDDGKQLLASTGEAVQVIDLATGRQLRGIETGGEPGPLAAHPRAALLATAGPDGVSIWSTATGERTARFARPGSARSIAFDDGGRRLAVGGATGTVAIWDLATGAGSSAPVTPRAASVVAHVAFGPGGVLATGTVPPSPSLLWSARSPTPPSIAAVWDARGARRWSADLDSLRWLGFRPGTDTLATASLISVGGRDGFGLTLWDGAGVGQVQPALGRDGIDAFAWSPDGARLAHDSYTSVQVSPVDGSGGVALEADAKLAAFRPGGGARGELALADQDGRISLWDTATARPRLVIRDEPAPPRAIAWSPDGEVLASASGDGVRLWDPRTGARLATLAAHADVTAIAFRPDGRLLAAACDDGLVELWSVADASLVVTLALAETRGLVLAPDGAADGALADDEPLRWVVGETALPGRASWERGAVPGLLAARLAAVPARTAPREGLPGAGPPRPPDACVTAPAAATGDAHLDEHLELVSASSSDDRTLSLCVGVTHRDRRARYPACFLFDVASGAFHPRAPTPAEALGVRERREPGVTIEGTRVTVCRAGGCRPLEIPELAGHRSRAVLEDASDDGGLVAVLTYPTGPEGRRSKHAIVYEVATGRRIRTIDVGTGLPHVKLLGERLLVMGQRCERCPPAWLMDPRTGKRIGAVGGAQPIEVFLDHAPARVTGDLWAFTDGTMSPIVLQDIRTGRVVHRFERPVTCRKPEECMFQLLHAGDGLAVIGLDGTTGVVVLLDARGEVVGQHRAPACKP